jgi:hypothetical protein
MRQTSENARKNEKGRQNMRMKNAPAAITHA